jgi:hypothetical protein
MHPMLAYQIAQTMIDEDLRVASQQRRARDEATKREPVVDRPRRRRFGLMSILTPRPR